MRAVVTLVARGAGHGVRPWKRDTASSVEDAEERTTALVLSACTLMSSYHRWRPRLTVEDTRVVTLMVVLTANLTSSESALLYRCGADRLVDLSNVQARLYAPPWIRQHHTIQRPTPPPWRADCTGTSEGNWIHLNRDDFPKTLLKFFAWNMTDFERFLFIDADGVFTGDATAAFGLLDEAFGTRVSNASRCYSGGRRKPACRTRARPKVSAHLHPSAHTAMHALVRH